MIGTCQRFKKGAVRDDGRLFLSQSGGWVTPDYWHRWHVSRSGGSAKRRAAERGLPYSINFDYLLSIFPKDGKCPVFRTALEWGGERATSPSLDRIHPALGYVPGNVIWVSDYANVLKNGNSLDTLRTLLNFYEGIQSGNQTPH